MFFRYLVHYKWLPFYVFSLAILYYFPYLICKEFNGDLISLVNAVKTPSTRNAEKVAEGYFNYKVNSKIELWISTIISFSLKVIAINSFVVIPQEADLLPPLIASRKRKMGQHLVILRACFSVF